MPQVDPSGFRYAWHLNIVMYCAAAMVSSMKSPQSTQCTKFCKLSLIVPRYLSLNSFLTWEQWLYHRDASNANSKNLKTGNPSWLAQGAPWNKSYMKSPWRATRNKPKGPFNKRSSYLLLNSWLLDSSWSSTKWIAKYLMHQELSACDWSNKPSDWTSGSGWPISFPSLHYESEQSTGSLISAEWIQYEWHVQSHPLLHASPSERSSDSVVAHSEPQRVQEYRIANECKINIRNGTSTNSHNHDMFLVT